MQAVTWTTCHPDGGRTRYKTSEWHRDAVDVYHRTARGHSFDHTECVGCGLVIESGNAHRPDCATSVDC